MRRFTVWLRDLIPVYVKMKLGMSNLSHYLTTLVANVTQGYSTFNI